MKRFNKILLIDDDELNTWLHTRILMRMEVCEQVICLHNSIEALDYVDLHYASSTIQKGAGHDLIFLDIHMPEVDGYEFLSKLENMDLDHSRFSIVLLTSSPYKKDRKKASQLGDKIDGYLVKPLEDKTVNELVEVLL